MAGDGEPMESLLRRFKREVNKSGHLMELRHRRYFEDSQDVKKRKIKEARRRKKAMRMAARKGRLVCEWDGGRRAHRARPGGRTISQGGGRYPSARLCWRVVLSGRCSRSDIASAATTALEHLHLANCL